MPPRSRTRLTAQPDPWTHHADLLAYARRMLGDEGRNAEDVVQDAYLRLTEQGVAGRVPDDDRRWLFRVVRNLALDERRRARYATPVSDPARGADRGASPGDVLERRQDVRQTLEDVADLPPRERRALVLDQAGLPTVEIARRMSTSQNAVHQALFRARRRLRSARAAAWGVMPLPLARLALRAGETRIPEMLVAAGTPGGGRLIPVAGVVGAAVVGILGGGAAVHEIARTPEVILTERTGALSVASVTPRTAPAPELSAATSRAAATPAVRPSGRSRATVPARARRIPAAALRAPSVNVRRAAVAAPSVRAATPAPAAAPAAPPAAGPGGHDRRGPTGDEGRQDRSGGHREHDGARADRSPHDGRGEDHGSRHDDGDAGNGARGRDHGEGAGRGDDHGRQHGSRPRNERQGDRRSNGRGDDNGGDEEHRGDRRDDRSEDHGNRGGDHEGRNRGDHSED